MKILIVYKSRHGTTQKAVDYLSSLINGDVTCVNLGITPFSQHPNQFDLIIIGGSIHASIIQSKVRAFCKKHYQWIMQKPLGLFLCCMDTQKATEQFEAAFYEEHRHKAIATGIFGGEFIFEKMNWFEKLVVRKVVKVNQSVSALNHDAIREFAQKINLELSKIGT